MEITIQNYRQLRNSFDTNKLNPAVLEVFNDVDADFEDYLELYTDASPENDGIRDVVNNHIKLVNKYFVEQPKATPRENLKKAVEKDFGKSDKIIVAKVPKVNFVSSKKTPEDLKKIAANAKKMIDKKNVAKSKNPIKPTISKTFVDNFPIEFQLIKRFWNMVDDGVTVVPFRKVQLLFNAFNKAALERKIRKTNDLADLFTKCSQKITKLYNEFAAPGKKDVEAVLTDRSLYAELQKYCTNVAVNPAVGVLKRYISIQNTKPDVKKVAVLIKAIDKVLTTDSDNRLAKELRSAKENLEEYIDNPKEYIDVEQFGLSRPATQKVCRNRVKCAGISKNGRLLKGYRFEEDSNNVIKVVKERLGSPNVCHNRVKCAGLTKDGKLRPGYMFREDTNEVVRVSKRKTTTSKKKPVAKKKIVAGLGFLAETPIFDEIEQIFVNNPVIVPYYTEPVQNEVVENEPAPVEQLARPNSKNDDTPKNKLMSMHFDSLEMDNGWENFMQDPAKNMRLAIWGKPKNGKTAGSLQFANYLTKFGKVLYNFADQGFNKSTQDLWLSSGLANNTKAEPSDIQTLAELEKEIAKGKYTFVFIDMISDYINREKISPTEFKDRFIKKFPNVSFILIFEVTKGGDFKGDQGWTHTVDAIVTVEDFLMQNRGRYGMGHHIVWEDGLKKFNPKKYAEIMEETEALQFNAVEQL